MTYGKAISMLESETQETIEAPVMLEAIDKILSMKTINAVSKDSLKNAVRFLRNHVNELLKEQEWISVKDRLPEVRHAVLGYAPFHKNIWTVTMREDGCWYFWYPGTSKYEPDWYGPITHWMPLPEKPGEEK